MPNFRKESRIAAPAAQVFDWHERPGAFARLTPPWEPVELADRQGSIRDGDRATLRIKQGPIALKWVAEHRDYIAGEQFKDVALSGPFPRWEHTHRVIPDGDDACTLSDSIDYALPGGPLGALAGGAFVRGKLARMFAYRHRVTADDATMIARYPQDRALRVLISGASGLVGSALVPMLSCAGHSPVILQRTGQVPPSAGIDRVVWNPATGEVTEGSLEGFDAVVHLAGAGVADQRWTTARKAVIRDSRTEGTCRLAEALAALENPPGVFVSASAVGYYGETGDTLVDETAPAATNFLAEVCRDWEAAADPARAAGIRVVHTRIGIVLSLAGGALKKMLPPFLLGAGGRLGHGQQYMSWIALDDVLGGIYHALMTPTLSGPVNLVAPDACTNAAFTQTLARVVRRPAIFPVPAAALRIAVGELTDEGLMQSNRVDPAALRESGYPFRFSRLEDALRHALGRVQPATSNT